MVLENTALKISNFNKIRRGETVETVRKTHHPRTLGMRETGP